MEEEMCKHEDGLSTPSPFKYLTTCVVSGKRFSFMTADKLLAKDMVGWIKESKILITSFEELKKAEKDSDNNKLTIEIRRC